MNTRRVALWRESELVWFWAVKGISVALVVGLALLPTTPGGPILILTLGGFSMVLLMAALLYLS